MVCIVIQIGGVFYTFCQEEGIFPQKYRDRNGRCIAILFKSIRGRFDSPDWCILKVSWMKPQLRMVQTKNVPFSLPRGRDLHGFLLMDSAKA